MPCNTSKITHATVWRGAAAQTNRQVLGQWRIGNKARWIIVLWPAFR
jgi:hypothetical protein